MRLASRLAAFDYTGEARCLRPCNFLSLKGLPDAPSEGHQCLCLQNYHEIIRLVQIDKCMHFEAETVLRACVLGLPLRR